MFYIRNCWSISHQRKKLLAPLYQSGLTVAMASVNFRHVMVLKVSEIREITNRLELLVVFTVMLSLLPTFAVAEAPPGIVIDHSNDLSGVYIGCPSIAILASGKYVASHSWFGPKTKNNETVIFASTDKGEHWKKLCNLNGQWWSTLFNLDKTLYILGVDKNYGNVVIRCSTDDGQSWTSPADDTSGLLLHGKYHGAPVPVVIHNNRIWRAFEQHTGRWGIGYQPFVISAPVGADLLRANSWTNSNRLVWGNWKPYGGWLEGNVVKAPNGELLNILRVHEPKRGGKAAIVEISADGKTLNFDSKEGFIDFQGGCKKFTIRYDEKTKTYWSLTNWEQDKDRKYALNAERQRNTLALISSENLRDWNVRYVVLYHRDVLHVGYQYADWQFEGDDIVAVSRTAFGNAEDCHNANYLTFHRIMDFRNRTINDVPLSSQF